MKVIFLDFDGVLNIEKFDNPWLGNTVLKKGYTDRDQFGLLFDSACVDHLKAIIDATGAKVVISSSWRYLGFDTIKELWKTRELPGEVIGMIPLTEDIKTKHSGLPTRGDCIQMWLEAHKPERYVIIDDTDDFLSLQKKHLIQTDIEIGITVMLKDQGIRLLKQK